MKQSKSFKKILEYFIIIIGCLFYAVGYSCFIEPSGIAPGGISGIALIIHRFFNFIPVGSMIIILNIPLFILGFRRFRYIFIIKTVFATAISSTFIDVSAIYLPKYNGDNILAALAGGVSIGVGLALIMLKGASTGGAEIIAMLLNSKYKFLSIGRLLLFVDAIVVTFSAVIFSDIDIILYSALCLFTSSTLIDKLLYGADRGKVFFIISSYPQLIVQGILSEVGRGATKLRVSGSYTEKERTMLMCVVRPTEVTKVIEIIKRCDRNAFVTLSDAGEILGEGFRNINSR